jgi:hypothetical protein
MTEHKPTFTNAEYDDGFGSQYQRIMAAIALCEYNDWEYLHTPFVNFGITHSTDVAEMNDFIGVPASPKIKDIHNRYDYVDIKNAHDHIQKVPRVKNPSVYYTNSVLNKIRAFYYSTDKPKPCQYDIAIHIRRGDVTSIYYRHYIVGNRKYHKIIKTLKAKFPNYSICIYSEGEIDDFAELQSENVHFSLNEDLKKTFHDMVTAKVLVTGKSFLSYSAALLSTNEIYYLPYWNNPLAHWKRFESNNIWGGLQFKFLQKRSHFEAWLNRFSGRHLTFRRTVDRFIITRIYRILNR